MTKHNIFGILILVTVSYFSSDVQAMKPPQKRGPIDKIRKNLNNFRRQERARENAEQQMFLRDGIYEFTDDCMLAAGKLELDEDMSELLKTISSFKDDAKESREQKIFLATTIPYFLNCSDIHFMRLILESARTQGGHVFAKMVTAPMNNGATRLHNAIHHQQVKLVHEILKQASNIDEETFINVVTTSYKGISPFYQATLNESFAIFKDFLNHARIFGEHAFLSMVNMKNNGLTPLFEIVLYGTFEKFTEILRHARELGHHAYWTIIHVNNENMSLIERVTNKCPAAWFNEILAQAKCIDQDLVHDITNLWAEAQLKKRAMTSCMIS
jgi:hypothetical protein